MFPVPDNIIFFDGICNLCNSFVQFVIRHDKQKRFYFSSLQSDFAARQLGDMQRPDSILLLSGGKLYTESSAALRIFRMLKGAWPLLYGLIIIPAFIRNALYRLVARNRYRLFGKRDECMLPSPELSSRFLP